MNKQNPNEKRDTRFIFSCVGGILYVVPSISCLAFGILSDGMSSKFTLSIITILAMLPISLFAMYCYKKKAHKNVLIALSAAYIVLHAVTAVLALHWYPIIAPDLILALIIMTHAKAVDPADKLQ